MCLEGWRCQNIDDTQKRGAVSFEGRTKEIVFGRPE